MVDYRDSDNIEELLAGYVLGDLSSEESATLNRLFQADPELQAEVSRLQKTLALIPLALPETPPSPALGLRILRAASGELGTETGSGRRRSNFPLGVIGSVVASVVIGLSFYNYHLHRRVVAIEAELSRYREAIALLRQPGNRLVSLKGTENVPIASGSLLVIPKSGEIVLTLQNLTPLPQGKIYRLWGVVEGRKVYCGEFNSDPQGRVLIKIPLDADMSDPSSVIVTVEPSRRAPYPLGKIVMTGSMSF